jgi:hypothetical protein
MGPRTVFIAALAALTTLAPAGEEEKGSRVKKVRLAAASAEDLLTIAAAAPRPLAAKARARLARLDSPRVLPYLVERAFLDKSSRVRRVALAVAVDRDRERVVRCLERISEARGGKSGRAFVQVGTQAGFLQDFDVEVAKTAFIAKPLPATINDGIVLDVKVLSSAAKSREIVRTRIRRALKKLAREKEGG